MLNTVEPDHERLHKTHDGIKNSLSHALRHFLLPSGLYASLISLINSQKNSQRQPFPQKPSLPGDCGGEITANNSQRWVPACAGTTNRVECRTLIFATRY
jgi:hypothetical protein